MLLLGIDVSWLHLTVATIFVMVNTSTHCNIKLHRQLYAIVISAFHRDKSSNSWWAPGNEAKTTAQSDHHGTESPWVQ